MNEELLEEADREEPRIAEASPEMIRALEDRFEFNMARPEEFRSWDEVKAQLKRAPHA